MFERVFFREVVSGWVHIAFNVFSDLLHIFKDWASSFFRSHLCGFSEDCLVKADTLASFKHDCFDSGVAEGDFLTEKLGVFMHLFLAEEVATREFEVDLVFAHALEDDDHYYFLDADDIVGGEQVVHVRLDIFNWVYFTVKDLLLVRVQFEISF